MHKAKYFEQKNNNSVECKLCNHFCLIAEGKVGICGARKNQNGILYSLVYGYPVALNVDPIEKKPLFHFMPGSLTYSLGTLGCNFACANCQNWDISQEKNIEKKILNLNFVSPERVIEDAIANGCTSISYTYTEPTIFTEYALDVMRLAHENELKNVWVSNGYMSKYCLDSFFPYLDAINVDLKSFDDNFYVNNCLAKLEPILDNLKYIKQNQVHLEITTLLIPSLSDDIGMIKNLADFIVVELDDDTPWHISKFSPNLSRDLKHLSPTGEDVIYEAYAIGKNAGLKYVYVGNIPGDQKENTYCPKCYELAIRRLGQHVERLDSKGRCSYCDRDLDIIE